MKIARFVKTLYFLLEKESLSSPTVAMWASDSLSFLIVRPNVFATTLLPKYFSHSNWTKFTAELARFGFRQHPVTLASTSTAIECSHVDFQRGNLKRLLHVQPRRQGELDRRAVVDDIEDNILRIKREIVKEVVAAQDIADYLSCVFDESIDPPLPRTFQLALPPPSASTSAPTRSGPTCLPSAQLLPRWRSSCLPSSTPSNPVPGSMIPSPPSFSATWVPYSSAWQHPPSTTALDDSLDVVLDASTFAILDAVLQPPVASPTVTKFSLVLGKETVASDAYSVCHTMFQPCEQLLAALKVAVFAGAGYALTKELCASVHRIFANVLDLSTRLHAKDLGRVPELTGRIWDACAALETLSKSNLISTKRVMLQTVAVLNDTVQELQGDVAAAKDALDNTIDDHDHLEQRNVELEDDLDFDMGSQTLTANELRQLQACVDVLQMAQAIAKKGVLSLNAVSETDGQDGCVQWGSSFPSLYDALHDAVVDLGADLSPPFEAAVVADHMELLQRVGTDVLTHLQHQPGHGVHADVAKGLLAFQGKAAAALQVLTIDDESSSSIY
ncbi:hypothetical protein DYB30_010664 [Aphanomyces astaci]|uniref:HSF-type DNA-binding domain-containing protein n=1 Tax=Aphanomyces astaci TaxID=112090 RepID=A0A397DVC8_APHAT|nr:hypothetical protein DYB30_010664 [Aphanomyces astaci]RHY71613.1 hypothetical protein DYB38_007343 [Aphanomyces astaci]RHZ27792.1 hypothetical protein DYB26_002885 [Aphanomyces astaci]